MIPGRLFAISSYAGHALTVQVLLAGGGVFSYLPLQALVSPKRFDPAGEALAPDELLYHDCRDDEICVHRYRALRGPVQAFLRKRQRWMRGKYLLSIDWYRGNDLLHLLRLENGQFAALPSHKLIFGEEARILPDYQKLRQTWRVEP